MFEEYTPTEKHAKHSGISKYLIIFSAWLGSIAFVTTLSLGAVFYHIYHKITGQERYNLPEDIDRVNGYVPRKAFPELEKMKPSKDLRYYALAMGLDLEEYNITTEDGFVLTLHHLIDPKESVSDRQNKKPVLLQHGLLSCSGAYLTTGHNSLAYHFIESGYDVWLGNNRSWFEPRHTFLEGNLLHNEEYWDWDIRELAYYDLPAIIENVLSHKPNHDKLILVGHSQGCTQSFIMLRNGNLSHIHSKIEYFFPLAPAIFPGYSFHDRGFIRFIHNKGKLGYKLWFGCCSFLPNLSKFRYYFATQKFFGFMSYIMFKFLFGWNARKWGKEHKVWYFCFVYNVTYVSSNLMSWWLSFYVDNGFSNQLQPKQAYKTGANHTYVPENENAKEGIPEKDDSKSFFPFKKSWFTDSNISVPMVIFTGGLDFLVDGKRLITHMRHYEPNYAEGKNLEIVEIDDYNHVDVVWAEDLIGNIGMIITDKLKSVEGTAQNSSYSPETEKEN
ncbi:Alpha/Beta hydrolase protein [Scheffersomyces xylosifermentans]|uniref:Alpha/Beta hydrolase protein n=1 Tax=Scheffersomyces xylosifermentans TaxID=1304137 RepID=UPI00315C5EEC